MKRRWVGVLGAAVTAVVVAAVPAGASVQKGLSDPIPGSLPVAGFSVGVQTVDRGLVSPTSGTFARGVPGQLFVTDQTGQIWAIDVSHGGSVGGSAPRLFGDLRSRLVTLGDVSPGSRYDERGLLGLAFSPTYRQDGLLYTYQTQPYQGRADFSTEYGNRANCRSGTDAGTPPFRAHPCQNVVTEWHVRNPGSPDSTIDPGSARDLMRIDKPFFNHNGGALAFGPDGYLYISVGDGGFGDDQGPGHVAGGNGQSLAPGNVLGKILRIDPRRRDSANHRYGIPATNPFVGREGADEIYAYGFRNPYRISFDPVSGRLLAGDTGQNNIEEVDLVRPGGNYGWPLKEGTFTFHAGSPRSSDDSWVTPSTPALPAGLIDPVAEYDHTGPHGSINGEATVGGFVYRGSAVPALAGRYVFGDYSRLADIGKPAGRLFFVNHDADPAHRVTVLPVRETGTLDVFLLGFARDSNGELYVLGSNTGTVAGHTGVVERITR